MFQEGLRELEDVCTKYRKVFASGTSKGKKVPPYNSPQKAEVKVKEEPVERESKSDWLYGTGLSVSVPPPLIRCAPAVGVQTFPGNREMISPPAKRHRKGTPHKVVTEEMEEQDCVPDSPDLQMSFNHDFSDRSSPFELDRDSDSMHELSFQDSHRRSSVDETSGDNLFETSRFNDTYNSMPCFDIPQIKTESTTHPSNTNSLPMARKTVPPCEVCGRVFPTREKMADHKRSHSEIKQFSCLMCNRFFKYRRGVTNHLKEVHRLKDRNEISNLVASHEVGCVPVKDASGKKTWVKQSSVNSCSNDGADGTVDQKVIEDTVSSLIENYDDSQHSTFP